MIFIAIVINILKWSPCVLKKLGIELLVTFLFVGFIEFWFFTNIAKQYIPVYPDIIVKSFQEQINSILK